MLHRYLLTFLLVFISFISFAGNITGVIKDASNGTPLSGVVVNLKNTDKGAQTDIDGKYEINDVPDGTYTMVVAYVTFKKQEITIKVKGNTTIEDVMMEGDSKQLSDVTVKSSRITRTENAVMMEIRKANVTVSAIGASQIAKTMDRSAADVVKRVPGVSIFDNRFIMVRGLMDRYNTVWLNDASAPSSEVDKKSFSFDILPSGLIDRILIFKTPSPELPGDFAGGMVKIYTTSIADKNQVTVGISTSSREFTTGTNFNYEPASKTDWLGYDNGKRSLPSDVPAYLLNTDDNASAISKSFGNDWAVKSKKAPEDIRFNLALSNVGNIKKVRIGNTLGVTYTNANTNYTIHKQDWDSTAEFYNYYDQQSANKVSVGLMDNIGVVFGNSKIEFRNLYNQIGESKLTIRSSDPNDTQFVPERDYAIAYESRASYATQLSGTHAGKDDNWKYNWTLGYTDLFKNIPDRRLITYKQLIVGADTSYAAQVQPGVDPINGGGRYYGQLFEHNYSFNHIFTKRINVNKDYDFDINAGNYIEYKSRFFWQRNFGYTIKPGMYRATLNKLPVDEIFVDSNVGEPSRYFVQENTNPSDKYTATNRLIASFISVKFPIAKRIDVLAGVRYENNIMSINSATASSDTISIDVTTKQWLPSVNAAYHINEKSLVRLAYGKTLNRPEFREWAPLNYYDFDERTNIYGSLYGGVIGGQNGYVLQVAEIQNYDARWEWYPTASEMIHAGVYYKSFKNPIQRIIPPGSSLDQKAYTFINATSAYCAGLEIDVRKSMGIIKDGPKVLNDLFFVGNLSLTKSEVKIDTIKNQLKNIPLQGQSPYVVNVGLYYQNADNGIQGSILYNSFGARITVLGIVGNGSVMEAPYNSLDFAISKTFYKHYALSVGVQNILGSKVRFFEDTNYDGHLDTKTDLNYQSWTPGRYYTIGIKVSF